MLTYTIELTSGLKHFVRKILHVEGNADHAQRDRLRMIFFDALSSSDHLILDLEEVKEHDDALAALVCSIHRTAKLMGKQLTVKGEAGALMPCRHGHAPHSRRRHLNIVLLKHCHQWERNCKRGLKMSRRLNKQLWQRNISHAR